MSHTEQRKVAGFAPDVLAALRELPGDLEIILDHDTEIEEAHSPGNDLEKLGERYPAIYEKLVSAEYWDELNDQAKNMLAESFEEFLKAYPERVKMVEASKFSFSILISDDARQSMKKNEMVLLDGLIYLFPGPNVCQIVIQPAGSVLEMFQRSAYNEAGRKDFLDYAVNVLRGLRP